MTIKSPDRANFWQQHCERFQASGLSRKAYCREHSLKIHQLSYQLDRAGKPAKAKSKSAFVRVVATAPVAARGPARLVFGGGMALEFDSGADPSWIASVIARVGGEL